MRLDEPPQFEEEGHDDHGGLHRDVPALVGLRDMLRMMGGVSLAGLLAACGMNAAESSTTTAIGPTTSGPTGTTTGQSSTTVAAGPGEEIPDETAGPFPADGSNGPNILDDDGIVRTDITSSIGGSSGVAEGVPITFNLSLVDASTGSPLPGGVVYLWHCTADGRYSIYEIEEENYLRGVQLADEAGRLSFTSVFPGCYAGRWPHTHFEVYASLDEASAGSAAIKTSQLALPQADCEAVYADSRYGNSASNLSRLSLDTDGIFADGWSDQLATMAGSVSEGYAASLLVRV
jgi:protocatechuate 3,4-dioxygenase beta subunit